MRPNIYVHVLIILIGRFDFRGLVMEYVGYASHKARIGRLKVEAVLSQFPRRALGREWLAEDLRELESEMLEKNLYKPNSVRWGMLTHPQSRSQSDLLSGF